ncbi:MAG: DNA replication/repair protein RecF [Rhodospirillaceae bacterium]|nr:DNA replication/repair protein RecF [Rhodospirillaceae bacterium]
MSPAQGVIGIVRVMLTDFRNYDHLNLELDTRSVVLAGANGAGKTNILEALSFLTAGRGLRGAKLADVGRCAPTETQERPWAVSADIETPTGSIRLGTGIEAATPDRRSVHIDGKPAKGASVLAQHVGAVWLTPAMDRLFSDAPGERRRFIDRLVTVLDPDHSSRCAAYDQAARRRARLFRDGVTDDAWFESLEDTLARYGVAIAAARLDTLTQLNHVLAAVDGPFPAAHLNLTGQIDDWLGRLPALDAEDAFRADLLSSRQNWPRSGEPPSPQGPNRSDLMVVMAKTGRPATDCSTGEQKALLVSIVLAHVHLQSERRGCPPLLLLDEVAAHLDKDRRRHLFERVTASGAQAWLTGTDVSVFADLGESAQLFAVSDGAVKPVSSATIVSHPSSLSLPHTQRV